MGKAEVRRGAGNKVPQNVVIFSCKLCDGDMYSERNQNKVSHGETICSRRCQFDSHLANASETAYCVGYFL